MCLGILSACWGCGGGGSSGGGGPPGTIQFTETSFDAEEGTIVNIRVARSGGSAGLASVDFATSDGDAIGGSDYTMFSGTLFWPDGFFGNRTLSIPIADDDEVEPTESFTVTLSNASTAMLGPDSLATVHILDNDPVDLVFRVLFVGPVPVLFVPTDWISPG